nr:MAG TPA: hypothetical protein [Bacteriophage sp.]
MDIKRFDTYRGVCVDNIGTKGDVSVVVTDTKYVCKPKEDTAAYELYKQIESGEVIAVAFYLIKEFSGMDRILRVILMPKADFEKMVSITDDCRYIGNKIHGLPIGIEMYSLEGAHLSRLSMY